MRKIICTCICLLVYGCMSSQVPLPETYDLSSQKKMQAAAHWNILARDVAGQVEKYMAANSLVSPVYIPEAGGDFGQGFRDLLITNLVQDKIQVVEEKTGSLCLNFKTQVVDHKASRFQRPVPGTFTGLTALAAGIYVLRDVGSAAANYIIPGAALGAGVVADYAVGKMASVSHHEIIVTVSLMQDKTYLLRSSDVYYINDDDWNLYATPAAIGSKNFQVR